MYCRRCGNSDKLQFRTTKKGTYCLRCQRFGKYYVDCIPHMGRGATIIHDAEYELPFELTSKQIDCAKQVVDYVSEGNDVLVYAACGAGKTEMTMPLITYALENGKKIGIAIPRKDVVIELGERYRQAFSKIHVVEVYGDHHDVTDGDLIIMTTHQLYRYESVFDILIIDEADAFPFANNEVLENIVDFACKGIKVFLSATPSSKMKELVSKGQMKQVTLFVRPHGGKLCVPKIVKGFPWYLWLQALCFINKYSSKTILLFVPTIRIAEVTYRIFSIFLNCCLVTSKSTNRETLNHRIKNGDFHLIICTTVLERGITVGDVQVIVYDATNPVFNEASLIQISGRVGRKSYAKEGECLLLCRKRSEVVESAVAAIGMMNNE